MNEKRKKGKKKWIVLGIIVVVLLLAFLGLRSCAKNFSSQMSAADIRTAKVETGSIATTVSGSGTLTSQDAQSITVPEGVEIDTLYVEAGDLVNEGDILATVDTASVLSAIADTQASIDELDTQLEEIREDTISESITAGISGRVKKIYVEKDSSVAATMLDTGALMLLSVDGKMALFLEGATASLGENVTVTLSNEDTYEGTVAEVVNGGITVTLTDKGPAYGDNATVTDEDGNVLGSGQLYIHSELRITGYTGTVASLSVSEGDWVDAGDTLLKLTDLGHTTEYENMMSQREELADQLQTLLALYEDNTIIAHFDGTIQRVDTDANTTSTSASTSSKSSDISSIYAAYMTMVYEDDSQSGGFILLSADENQDNAENNDEYSGETESNENDGNETDNNGDTNEENNNVVITPVTLDIMAGVLLEGGSIADYAEQFTFVLLQDEDILQLQVNDAYGLIAFYTLIFTEPGNYTYQLGQIPGTDSTITYDDIVYTLDITVTAESDGTLSIQADVTGDYDGAIIFTNILTTDNTDDEPMNTGGSLDINGITDNIDISSLQEAYAGSTGSYSSSLTDSILSSYGSSSSLTSGYNLNDYTGVTASTSTAASSGNETTILTISPNETMSVSISVDELDILSLEKGQTASITIDAIEGETFSGTVTSIDTIGSSSGGVTKFTVQVEIEKNDSMLSGMNASVEIITAESDNCLIIPENALNQSGNTTYIYTTYDESTDTLGGETEITTGVSDGTNVEILSGLQEGDTIYYRYTESRSIFDMYGSMWSN